MFKHCCYYFVRWTVYHLSVCRKVNRQYKYNLSCTMHYHRHPYRRNKVRRHFTESWKIITGKCHNYRKLCRRPTVRRHFTKSWKIITGKCHNYRCICKRPTISRYVVGGSILSIKSPTACANSKGRCIKCISDRVKFPTDREKYGG